MTIYKMADEGNLEQALAQLDKSPAWLKRTPEYLSLRATLLDELGETLEAGSLLREVEQKHPRFFPVYPSLASWYLTQNWPGHTLQTARKALANFDLDADGRELMNTFIKTASAMIQVLADELKVSAEMVEKATLHHERAQMELLQKNYSEVERLTMKALELLPHWNAPRNNLAYVLNLLGRRKEALAETEKVLANDPANVHGLKNAVIVYLGLGQEEKAREFGRRLLELIPLLNNQSNAMDVVISALAMLEDSESLWDIAQRFLRKPQTSLLDYSWHCLGVAAARLSHLKEAKKLLERGLQEAKEGQTVLDKVNQAIKSGAKRLLWPPPFPGMEVLLSERMLIELGEIAEKVKDNRPTANQQRKIDALLEKYPSLPLVFKRMMWNEDFSAAGTNMLAMLNKPEADAEIMRFGLSDWGDNDSRMAALMALVNAGRYSPNAPIRFWDADNGIWCEAQLFTQQIGEVEYEIKPQTAALIEKSRGAKNPEEAIALLRRAVQDDPTCAMAVFNLGVLLMKRGEEDEGEALMRRSVEVDPTYIFGHANLGLLEAQRGNKEAALDHLTKVTQAKVIDNNTASVSSLAYMVIAMDDGDIEMARRHFNDAARFQPDNPVLEHFQEMLEEAEESHNFFGFIRDFQKQSANRYHRKMLNTPLSAQMGLEACLSNLTKDNLVGMARFWNVVSYGKKDELVSRLTRRILDVEGLKETIPTIKEAERDALQWVLEGGGSRPWAEFIARFGDDMDESAAWNYHIPQTIPGRLKWMGFLFVGKLEGQESAFIPADLRAALVEALKS